MTQFATVSSRRKPYPYDILISGFPVILHPQETGLYVGRKIQTMANIAPITYDYSSQPVYAERTFPFRNIIGGYGERVQSSVTPNRYRYALRADLSIGGLMMKGPLVHSITPATTGSVSWFLDALHGGNERLFAAAGRYVLVRTNDTPGGWTASKDFGVGRTITKMVRFRAAGVGQPDALWVTTDNGQLWRYDGTTWSMSTQQAFSMAVLREEFWIVSDTNGIRKAVADPLVAGNFAAQINVGDLTYGITNIEVLDSRLFIFKTNGVFTINADTSANDLYPDLRQQIRADNGVNAKAWLSRLWFGYGDGYYYLDADGGLNPVGPGLLVENDTEVKGQVMDFAGHASWFGYYGLSDETQSNSYLVKHGTWLAPEDVGGTAGTSGYVFNEALNGAVCVWHGKRLRSMYVSDAAGGNQRLYFGFQDGSIDWILLPNETPNPAHPDSGCEFTEEDSVVYWPLHHAMFQADAKNYRGFSVFGPVLDTDQYVTVQYRVGSLESYQLPVDVDWTEVGQNFVYSGERHNLQPTVSGYAIEIRHVLSSNTGSTPIIEGVAVHEAVRPALMLEYNWTVNARTNLARRDGVVDRRSPTQIREAMQRAASSVGPVVVYLPDEGEQDISIVDYSEHGAAVTKRYGLEWDIAMKGVQFRTLTVYGTWDRVASYTWDDIALFTWDDLLVI